MASELKAYVDYEKQYISKFAGASYLSSKKTMLPVPDDEILTLGTDPENRILRTWYSRKLGETKGLWR